MIQGMGPPLYMWPDIDFHVSVAVIPSGQPNWKTAWEVTVVSSLAFWDTPPCLAGAWLVRLGYALSAGASPWSSVPGDRKAVETSAVTPGHGVGLCPY